TAELHRAFAMKSGDPAFEPEPLTAEDVDTWRARVRQEAEQTLKLVETHDKARGVAAQKAKNLAFIDACGPPKKPALKTRRDAQGLRRSVRGGDERQRPLHLVRRHARVPSARRDGEGALRAALRGGEPSRLDPHTGAGADVTA